MSDGLFNNKYRIKSARLAGYDYARDGCYFVTICTKDRINYFGDLANKEMILNYLGMIVADEWQKSEIIREYVRLDE